MKILWNDIKYTSQLREYFFSNVPNIAFSNYNFKTQKAYLNVHLDYICEPTLDLSFPYWFENDLSVLPKKTLFTDNYRELYEVIVKRKRNTIDLTCFIRDHSNNHLVTDYIKYIEDRIQQKITYGLFTYCDKGMYLPIHKDVSDIQQRRLHHVISNGDVSSIVFYNKQNNQYVVEDEVFGNPGDVFWFDAYKKLHNFNTPITERLHFILSTESNLYTNEN
jgi:hypothetical protein